MKYLFPFFLLCLSSCVWKDRLDLKKEYAPIESPIACDGSNCGKKCWEVDIVSPDGTKRTVERCALALPAHLDSDYALLRDFIEKRYPKYSVVFVHEDERLLNPDAQDSRITVVGKAFKVKGLKIYLIGRGA